MKRIPTSLPDVILLEPTVFGDERGFFLESWNSHTFADLGIQAKFVQDNHSRSARHVLRGLHFQVSRPQGKLVRAVSGSVFDVAVDIRQGSPSFGRWTGHLLSAANRRLLWIPPGFAHGFLSLEDGTDFLYKCTEAYAPAWERSLAWNDPAIGIRWPLDGEPPLLSAKAANAPRLTDMEVYA